MTVYLICFTLTAEPQQNYGYKGREDDIYELFHA